MDPVCGLRATSDAPHLLHTDYTDVEFYSANDFKVKDSANLHHAPSSSNSSFNQLEISFEGTVQLPSTSNAYEIQPHAHDDVCIDDIMALVAGGDNGSVTNRSVSAPMDNYKENTPYLAAPPAHQNRLTGLNCHSGFRNPNGRSTATVQPHRGVIPATIVSTSNQHQAHHHHPNSNHIPQHLTYRHQTHHNQRSVISNLHHHNQSSSSSQPPHYGSKLHEALTRELPQPAAATVPKLPQQPVKCSRCGHELSSKCLVQACGTVEEKKDEISCRRCGKELTTKCILSMCNIKPTTTTTDSTTSTTTIESSSHDSRHH